MSTEIVTEDVDLNNDEDLDLETGDDEQGDSGEKADDKKSDDKPKETSEQRVARLRRQLAREEKKLGISSDKQDTKDTKEKATKSGELDYGQKAYLFATGVKGGEEISLVRDFMANTGKSLEEVVDSKFFQAELKELRESKASSDAVPKGSKRTGQSSKDSVDYWLAKGELPENTPENQELRRKVVNARYERESKSNKFAPSSTGNVVRQSQLRK
jgi:hypothetical protein